MRVGLLCWAHVVVICVGTALFLIVRGGADVSHGGKLTHTLHEHQFVGDMGLSAGICLSRPVMGGPHAEGSEPGRADSIWARRLCCSRGPPACVAGQASPRW